jgi:hypothetical protein
MAARTSPGGSIFPYFYKNGELFGVHFGSFFSNEDGIIALMKAEALFFSEQYHSMPVWVDFYETKLTDRVLGEFLGFLEHVQPWMIKLGIVGCSFWDKRRISKLISQTQCLSQVPVRFFRDPEVAKSWLVGKHE